MRITHALAPLALAVAALGACGDDSGSTPAESPAAWIQRVGPLCTGGDPGFDQFYTDHPNPTAADYATFLPTPLAGTKTTYDCVKDNPPPKALADEYAEVVAAFDDVVDDLSLALTAAKADDLDKVNQYVGKNHDTDVPALEAAFERLIAAVGPAPTTSAG